MQQEQLLGLLLYAVNEANGWHDDSRGGNIKSPEMEQCIAVLAAHGRCADNYDSFAAPLAARDVANTALQLPLGGQHAEPEA